MNEDAKLLLEVTNEIADSDAPLKSFGPALMQLGLMLRRLFNEGQCLDQLKAHAPTVTADGIALNPWDASMCLEDHGRSAAFIRGTVRAVEHLLRKNPDRAIRWTEAGCGPMATLSLPVMARFAPKQLQVQLVDLHQASLDAAQRLIERLGLSDRLSKTICGDLSKVPLADDQDIVVLETMAPALVTEPQVALTRILSRRMPSAMLLPQSISVELQLIDPVAENREIPPSVKQRRFLGEVFRLTRETALKSDSSAGFLPAASIRLPKEIEAEQRPFLTTTVEVFEGVTVSDYDAAITLPYPLLELNPSHLGRELTFCYQLGASPRFVCSVD